MRQDDSINSLRNINRFDVLHISNQGVLECSIGFILIRHDSRLDSNINSIDLVTRLSTKAKSKRFKWASNGQRCRQERSQYSQKREFHWKKKDQKSIGTTTQQEEERD